MAGSGGSGLSQVKQWVLSERFLVPQTKHTTLSCEKKSELMEGTQGDTCDG